MQRSSTRMLAASVVALGVGACAPAARTPGAGDIAPAVQTDAARAAAADSASERAADRARRGYTAADVRFMQQMIAHHAQALEMTALVPARAASERIGLLAERIAVSQRDEIAMMQRWLRERGEAVPDSTGSHGAHGAHGPAAMPGMLSEAELARLAAARGIEFDRLLLELMIRHHEGAVAMVAELLGTRGAAQDTEVFRFASDVDADQRAEIRRMRDMLNAYTSTPPR